MIGAGTFDTSFFPSFDRNLLIELLADGSVPSPINTSHDVGALENPNASPKAFLIIKQPQDQNLKIGLKLILKVEIASPNKVKYQWYLNGEAIQNTTLDEYEVKTVSESDFGDYYVKVYTETFEEYSQAGKLSKYVDIIDNNLTDSDLDGLTDFYELNIGTNPNISDTDSDGFQDGYEIRLQSNPLDQNDTPLGWLNIYKAVELEFHTENNKLYQLQYTEDLENWIDDGPLVNGTGEVYSTFVKINNLSNIFWRLKIK